jgi:hypothetical protein
MSLQLRKQYINKKKKLLFLTKFDMLSPILLNYVNLQKTPRINSCLTLVVLQEAHARCDPEHQPCSVIFV